ncbi:hypothetical protein VFPPC_17665 [Pochonia chlamydosporia 170]|uniref:Secreted protein n=1 Tax=Pochonia chlamydosporia 170 TaxID=1380566 RepID=A0A219ARC8_METCM|nr:hypothetical protein VFPPC_17665 [Pochonia chlamydosporia 170]OWT43159.1 hypothetical protein VFPPC_17665 [Pochonia chlamydosporia 170]
MKVCCRPSASQSCRRHAHVAPSSAHGFWLRFTALLLGLLSLHMCFHAGACACSCACACVAVHQTDAFVLEDVGQPPEFVGFLVPRQSNALACFLPSDIHFGAHCLPVAPSLASLHFPWAVDVLHPASLRDRT